MFTSLARHLVTASLALSAVAPALALSACAQPELQAGSTLRFALSTTSQSGASPSSVAPALHVGEVRVLSRHPNLQQPVFLGAAGANVTVTFAARQREGATVTLDGDTLETKRTAAFTYPAYSKRATPPFVATEPSRAVLASGGSVSCWTDDASGRVLAQAFGADGTWRGSPVPVSPEGMDVFGAPQIATADGRHVVATFFVNTDDGFELVAASLESVR